MAGTLRAGANLCAKPGSAPDRCADDRAVSPTRPIRATAPPPRTRGRIPRAPISLGSGGFGAAGRPGSTSGAAFPARGQGAEVAALWCLRPRRRSRRAARRPTLPGNRRGQAPASSRWPLRTVPSCTAGPARSDVLKCRCLEHRSLGLCRGKAPPGANLGHWPPILYAGLQRSAASDRVAWVAARNMMIHCSSTR